MTHTAGVEWIFGCDDAKITHTHMLVGTLAHTRREKIHFCVYIWMILSMIHMEPTSDQIKGFSSFFLFVRSSLCRMVIIWKRYRLLRCIVVGFSREQRYFDYRFSFSILWIHSTVGLVVHRIHNLSWII